MQRLGGLLNKPQKNRDDMSSHKPSKKKGRRIRGVADVLVSALQSKGIKVMRYDAYSSNSIYLKFDYGLLYTLRLSDHRGKRHLVYRFNAIYGYKGPGARETKWGWYQEFYTLQNPDLNEMYLSILELKKEQLQKYGPIGYKIEMQMAINRNKHNKGFWKAANDLG